MNCCLLTSASVYYDNYSSRIELAKGWQLKYIDCTPTFQNDLSFGRGNIRSNKSCQADKPCKKSIWFDTICQPTACVALETDQMRPRKSVRPALTVFCTLSGGPLAVTNARGLQSENTVNGVFYKKTLDSKFLFRSLVPVGERPLVLDRTRFGKQGRCALSGRLAFVCTP